MPNRILREGILTSSRVDALASWAEECFYRRLISVVDDYGRYFAQPMLLRAACFPLKLNRVSDLDIETWLASLQSNSLLLVYEQAGARFLELADFRQQRRATKSKFPDPPADAVPLELPATAAPPAQRKRKTPALNGAFLDFWSAYPRKIAKADAERAWIKLAPDDAQAQAICAAVAQQKQSEAWKKDRGAFIPHPATWLNGKRWTDEIQDAAASPASGPAWWSSDALIEAKGRELGMTPNGGETYAQYKGRIQMRLNSE